MKRAAGILPAGAAIDKEARCRKPGCMICRQDAGSTLKKHVNKD